MQILIILFRTFFFIRRKIILHSRLEFGWYYIPAISSNCAKKLRIWASPRPICLYELKNDFIWFCQLFYFPPWIYHISLNKFSGSVHSCRTLLTPPPYWSLDQVLGLGFAQSIQISSLHNRYMIDALQTPPLKAQCPSWTLGSGSYSSLPFEPGSRFLPIIPTRSQRNTTGPSSRSTNCWCSWIIRPYMYTKDFLLA